MEFDGVPSDVARPPLAGSCVISLNRKTLYLAKKYIDEHLAEEQEYQAKGVRVPYLRG